MSTQWTPPTDRSDASAVQLYPNGDPRELPAHTVRAAAHLTGVPAATLRDWILGRPGRFRPVIVLPDSDKRAFRPHQRSLSFINLVEAHVLAAIRRHHKLPLPKVRRAVNYLKQRYRSPHPLADHHLHTDGINLFIEEFGKLINISQQGQIAMREILAAYLQRIDRDDNGVALRFYPFIRAGSLDQPKMVVIDPRVSFGRPVLAGTGIPTAVIAGCYKAGDSIRELAHEYGRKPQEIEEAIRCELWLQEAA